MKGIITALAASALLLVPAAAADNGAPDAGTKQRPQREILVRGVAVAISPISVRASIGAIITCGVRNRALVADLQVGDRVLMKCVAHDSRLFLKRLVIHPAAQRPEQTRDARVVPDGTATAVRATEAANARDETQAPGR